MDWESVTSLAGPGLVVAVVLGVTFLIRKTTVLMKFTGWLPVVAAATGTVAGAFALAPDPWTAAGVAGAALKGLILGLIASGGYDVAAAPGKIGRQKAGGFIDTRLLALLVGVVLVAATLAGCSAPGSLRNAQVWERQAMLNVLANEQRMGDAWAAVYRMARQADIDATTEASIALIKTKADPVEVEKGVRFLMVMRDKALADTEKVIAKFGEMRAVNLTEAKKALDLHGAVTEWMEAGLDASAIPAMAQEVLGLIEAFKKPAATP